MASPVYRDSAVVLRTYRLAEADRIVVLMTERVGPGESADAIVKRQRRCDAVAEDSQRAD